MKKKINFCSVESDMLSRKELNELNGGNSCTCGCQYAGNGGSSSDDNGEANYAGNKQATSRTVVWIIDVPVQEQP